MPLHHTHQCVYLMTVLYHTEKYFVIAFNCTKGSLLLLFCKSFSENFWQRYNYIPKFVCRSRYMQVLYCMVNRAGSF